MNKNGMSLQDLAREIERIEAGKKDLVVPTTKMSMFSGRDLFIEGAGTYELSTLAHEQIGARLNIPRDYYRRMQEREPFLLDQNVNTWLKTSPEKRLVRTVDGNVRAFLSDRYKPLENAVAANQLLPALFEMRDKVQIVSSNISDKFMHIKVISHELEGEVKVGQIVRGGISVRNSEVGCGAFDVSLFVMVLACMNGMIREHSMKAYHVGKRLGNTEVGENVDIYAPETLIADSQAFALKVRDTIRHAFDRQKFEEELERFRMAADNKMNTKVINESIEDVTKRFSLNVGEGKEVLSRLLEAGDFTQWGLSNAVTNLANDVDSYDRATELEKIGGQIIDLSPRDWRTINKIAA